jgi:hypothetical protein
MKAYTSSYSLLEPNSLFVVGMKMFRIKLIRRVFYDQYTQSVSLTGFEIINQGERSCQNCNAMRTFPNTLIESIWSNVFHLRDFT